MRLAGQINITKEYDDGRTELVLFKQNTISDGIGYGLANLFSTRGSGNVKDYGLSYFQLGNGISPVPSYISIFNKNFYELGAPFTASQYGTSSNEAILNLNQVINAGGTLSFPAVFGETSAIFVKIPESNRTAQLRGGYATRIKIPKNLANGELVSEIGLFMKNPDGNAGVDSPILVAYKHFDTAILKSPEFALIIDWSLFVTDSGEDGPSPGNEFPNGVRLTFDMASGTGEFDSGDENNERFELIVCDLDEGPTAKYPLVVAIHGLGQQMTQFRGIANYNPNGDGTNRPIPLANQVIDRKWFYLAPLGKTTSSGPYWGEPSIAPLKNTQGSLYTHSNAIISNWNSIQAFNHVKKVVKYAIDHYPVDKNRIYFVGFSAGGGCVANFASKLLDTSPSAFRVAGVVAASPSLNIRKTWWEYAPSAGGATPLWNTPPNNALRSSGKVAVYWTAGSGNPDAMFAELLPNNWQISTITLDVNSNGPLWPSLSALTPSDTPFPYFELNTVDYNLLTSATYSPSTCTLGNLKHIPFYQHFMIDDSQGGFIYEPNLLLSSLLLTSGVIDNYKIMASSLASLQAIYPLATENHAVYTLDSADALGFLASATLYEVYSASTIFTRTDRYWYFDLFSRFNVPPITTYYDTGLLTSGLGLFVWSVDPTNNALYVSASKNCYDNNNFHTIFYPTLVSGIELTMPLTIYNLSNLNYPVGEDSGNVNNRRIGINGYQKVNLTSVVYYNYSGTGPMDLDTTGINCTYSTPNWTAAGIGTVAVDDTADEELQIRRVGKYELTP